MCTSFAKNRFPSQKGIWELQLPVNSHIKMVFEGSSGMTKAAVLDWKTSIF